MHMEALGAVHMTPADRARTVQALKVLKDDSDSATSAYREHLDACQLCVREVQANAVLPQGMKVPSLVGIKGIVFCDLGFNLYHAHITKGAVHAHACNAIRAMGIPGV